MGRPCDACGDASDYANGHGAWCEAHTARARHEDAEAARWDAMCALEGCENSAGWDGMGRARKYCSNAHSQKAYRLRKAAAAAAVMAPRSTLTPGGGREDISRSE